MAALDLHSIQKSAETGSVWERARPLRLESVHVRRRDSEILRGIDLVFEPSRRYVIVGPSGSGKTTMLRLLNRLEDPMEGKLLLGEVPLKMIPAREVRSHVGLVFQTPRPLPGMLFDNLAYPFQVRGAAIPHSDELSETLREVGIEPKWLSRDVSGLSGGERQRLALAVALGMNPEILVMDEPTSALDPASARRISDLLAERAETSGLRTIVVTHHRGHAPMLGDTAVRMEAGRVVEVGEIADVLSGIDDAIWQEGNGS